MYVLALRRKYVARRAITLCWETVEFFSKELSRNEPRCRLCLSGSKNRYALFEWLGLYLCVTHIGTITIYLWRLDKVPWELKGAGCADWPRDMKRCICTEKYHALCGKCWIGVSICVRVDPLGVERSQWCTVRWDDIGVRSFLFDSLHRYTYIFWDSFTSQGLIEVS